MAHYEISTCTLDEYEKITSELALKLTESISFLQAPLYGRVQVRSGKDAVCCIVRRNHSIVGAGLGIVYEAPGGLRYLYFPYGPYATSWDPALVEELRSFLRPIALNHGCAFARLDSDAMKSLSVATCIPDKIARTASLQPRAEWILDITQTSEEIWQGFHKHARYNVRLAERVHAITTVYKPSDAPLDDFYALMRTTSSRDGFGIFDKSYYDSYLKSLDANDGFLVVTTIDDQPAAVGLFAVYDQQAHYVFAGSSNQFRKIAPAYAVIWSAIQEAQDRGCTQINFGGISDTVKGLDLHGVTSFKKRFGGYRVDHDNPVDFVYMPLKYSLFRLYKTVR